MNLDRLVTLAGVLAVGCTEGDLEPLASPDLAADPLACPVPPGLELLPSGSIVADDIVVGTLADLEAACAAGRPFPMTEPGTRGIGQAALADLWEDGVVYYDIDSELPLQSRITDAIAQWEASTSLVFVERTTEADYVFFTNGNSCSSPLGFQGNRQDIELSTSKTASEIVGTGVSPAGDVYTWYADGMVSAGTSTDLDATRAQYAYSLPAGYTTSDIVAIAIANDGDVYTWYDDGRRSIGSTSDLDEQSAPVTYLLPPGKTAFDIVEIDIAVDSDVYAWFDDSTVSIGTSTDLDAHASPVSFTRPAGRLASDLVGVAIANDGDVYAWFDDRTVSIGTSTDLDALAAPVTYTLPGGCGVSAVVHEIGHAIGLYHEQAHPDRDDYVRVFDDNIQVGKEHNFCTADDCPWGLGWLLSTDYDVTSRMHYESYAFSVDGSPTILELATPGATVSTSDVIDTSISPSGDVYTWWADGTVTSGTSDDLELHRSRYAFTVPTGKAVSDIVGVMIAKGTGDTYTFYDDNTRSIGDTADLDSVSGPVAYTLPNGYTAADIVAIDHAPNGRTYTWFDDGFVYSGTSTDLDAYSGPTAYAVATGRSRPQVLGIAISASGTTYAWYGATGDVSAGSTTDFDSVRSLYDFRSRGIEIVSSPTLTAGDIAQVEAMYDLW